MMELGNARTDATNAAHPQTSPESKVDIYLLIFVNLHLTPTLGSGGPLPVLSACRQGVRGFDPRTGQ